MPLLIRSRAARTDRPTARRPDERRTGRRCRDLDAGRDDVVVRHLGPRAGAGAQALGVPVVPPPSGDDLLPMPTPGLGRPVLPGVADAAHARRRARSTATSSPSSTRWPTSTTRSSVRSRRRSSPRHLPCWPTSCPRDARALDAGCGAGRELKAVARLLDRGEVVGVDLAAEMVQHARAAAAEPPGSTTRHSPRPTSATSRRSSSEAFDLVYCCLAHHHYPDPPAAARSIHRALRPGGVYAIVDPGPAWFNAIAAPLAKWSDPGWISFHSEHGFRDLLLGAGFGRVRWHELLPGFSLVIAQRTD